MSGTHVALCSGGRESVVATHAAMTWGPAEIVVHLDTGTAPTSGERAPQKNRDYLRELCDTYGWQLWVLRTGENWSDLVREKGFFGPKYHLKAYNRLKDRQICKLASISSGDLHCWTGMRRLESKNRMEIAEPESERGKGRWIWRFPIVDWRVEDIDSYVDTFDLPENPLWSGPLASRSSECWCGSYATREELLDLEAAGFEAHSRWIRDLEDELEEREDLSREQKRFAGYKMDKSGWAKLDEGQITLCSSCGADYPTPDGSREDREVNEEAPASRRSNSERCPAGAPAGAGAMSGLWVSDRRL